MNNIILTGNWYWLLKCKLQKDISNVCKGVRSQTANWFVLLYFTAQSRMENQHSLYQSSSNQLGCHQYKVNPKIKNNGGERMVQSQIHFISFIFCWFFCCLLGLFFFTVQVVLAGFSKLYVKLTVNKPDYGYWLLQSVSPLVEKTKTKRNKKKKQQTTLCSVSCWRCADSESDWINLWLLC